MSTTAPDLAAVKARQRATWASGDYSAIGTLIVPVAEDLCDTADLRSGTEVLDVATGSGNAAIAAARMGCRVTGVDYVPALLERARERAAAERLDVAFAEGDAEALPFGDASFDAVTSVFGAMFAPDHAGTAAEIARVCRPGGAVALAAWTPEGFLGDMFRTLGAHVPPPAGVTSPMSWGRPEHLEDLFGGRVEWERHARRDFTFRFTSPQAFTDTFLGRYGPTLRAAESLEPAGRAALAADLTALASTADRLGGDGSIAVPAEYLVSVGTRV